MKRAFNLSAQPQRFFIDDEYVGLKFFSSMTNDRFPHDKRILEIYMLVERGVFAISKFDDTWNFDKVHTRPVVKSARNRRTRHNQDVETTIILHKGVSDGLTPSQMTE